MAHRPTPVNTSTLKNIAAPMLATMLLLALGYAAVSVPKPPTKPKPIAPAAKPATTLDTPNWSAYYPQEYATWKKTSEMPPNTKWCGSSARDYLAADPKLVVLFAGFAFSKQYDQGRGHAYTIEDVTTTKRLSDATPATCWTCKSPDVPRLIAKMGAAAFYGSKFSDLKTEITHPVGCPDCHDPTTMQLRVSRPAIIEAFERQGKDIKKATNKELRSLVCAQCHTSYFVRKGTNYLVQPWDKGLNADQFDAYYEQDGFSDWTHPISGAKMIKTRHPDYEVHKQGVHAFRGLSCADCHMPTRGAGAAKFTDHQVRSPLYNIKDVCGKCHTWGEKALRERVYDIQDKNRELLDISERALVLAHVTIGDASARGASDAELDNSRHLIRRAQMYWDYVASSNGMGFHAPQECARLLAKATDLAQNSRIDAERMRARHGATDLMEVPDISTKEKAWEFIKPYVDAQKAKTQPQTK